MEVYPEEMDGTPCTVYYWGYTSILRKIITVIPYHLIFNAMKMSTVQLDVNVANGVATDVANDVKWMEVYSFRFHQSKSLLHTKIKWYEYKNRLLLRCIHHFKMDLINNMDHMRILGTEPSSLILSQTK